MTQLHLLPTEFKDIEIQNVGTLENAAGLEAWKLTVRLVLRSHRCHNLIRTDLPRPTQEDKGYQTWEHHSRAVALWLYFQVSNAIKCRLDIRKVTKGDAFADVVMEKIEKIVVGGNPVEDIFVKLNIFWSIDRKKYPSVSNFIIDFLAEMQIFHDSKVPIPWIVALERMLQQLKDELPIAVLMQQELKDVQPE